jgi:hypothetical protein
MVNWVNSIFTQKKEKPISLGLKAKPKDCISEAHEVKQDCFPLITSTTNDVNDNDFVNNLNNRMCGSVMENLVCSVNHSSSKGPVNKTSGSIRKASVTKSGALLW